jgi:hypothetical protein
MNVLCELPLARALIAAHGRETALEILRRTADENTDERIHTLIWDAVRSKIERYRDEENRTIRLQCVFLLSGNDDEPASYATAVHWDNEGIVAHGRTIPETMTAKLPGRPMSDILDHPFLAGLTLSTVQNHHDDGTCAVVADAADSMRALERIEEAA